MVSIMLGVTIALANWEALKIGLSYLALRLRARTQRKHADRVKAYLANAEKGFDGGDIQTEEPGLD